MPELREHASCTHPALIPHAHSRLVHAVLTVHDAMFQARVHPVSTCLRAYVPCLRAMLYHLLLLAHVHGSRTSGTLVPSMCRKLLLYATALRSSNISSQH